MINNALIQAAWISKLKSNIAVTALVSSTEIKENQWKGTDFSYPAIRVKLTNFAPTTMNNNCQIFRSDVSILVFGEQKSSKSVDEIAGVVTSEFWQHPFSSGGVKFTAINWTNTVPAYVPEGDENVWISEVNFACLVQSA